MSERHVVVLGGGISGLAAANRVREDAAARGDDVRVTLLERSARAGGCIETYVRDGFVAELGPDSLVTEKPAALDLARRLGLGDDVAPMRPEYRGARIVRGGRLVPIPDDFRFFTPTSLAALVNSRLFDPPAVLRAAVEPFIPARRDEGDESLASFVTRRFGRQVLDRLAQPLIGGIYSGDPSRLSMRATLPMMQQIERKHGSMIRGMRALARNAPNAQAGQRLVSLRGGLGSMTALLAARLGEGIRYNAEVTSLRAASNGAGRRWQIALADGDAIEADAVICALPAKATSRLLAGHDAELARLLAGVRYHSVSTVTLAYKTRDLPELPRSTGFVVPFVEGRSIMSMTISSQKFEGRSPEGTTLLRAFAGGAMQPHVAAMQDDELLAGVRRELNDLLQIACEPEWTLIRRWPEALPEYAVGHVDLVARIERRSALLGNFALAGSAYRGVGIADCIRSGEEAALAVI